MVAQAPTLNKCDDKYCPECGHHVFDPIHDPAMLGYWCAECCQWIDEQNAAILDADIIRLRAAYDARARQAEQENERANENTTGRSRATNRAAMIPEDTSMI